MDRPRNTMDPSTGSLAWIKTRMNRVIYYTRDYVEPVYIGNVLYLGDRRVEEWDDPLREQYSHEQLTSSAFWNMHMMTVRGCKCSHYTNCTYNGVYPEHDMGNCPWDQTYEVACFKEGTSERVMSVIYCDHCKQRRAFVPKVYPCTRT